MPPGWREPSGTGAGNAALATSLQLTTQEQVLEYPYLTHGIRFSTAHRAATLPLPARPPAPPLQPGHQSEQALRRVRQAQPTVLPSVQWVTTHTQGLPSRVHADFLHAPPVMCPEFAFKAGLHTTSTRPLWGGLQGAYSTTSPDCLQATLSKGDR